MARPKRSCEHLGVCQARGFPCGGCTWRDHQSTELDESWTALDQMIGSLLWALLWLLLAAVGLGASALLVLYLNVTGSLL